MNLNDKIAVITGGTKGIGYAIAETLLEAGAKVSVCACAKTELKGVMKKLLTSFVILIGIQFCFGQNNRNSDYSRERQREYEVQKGLSDLNNLGNMRPEISVRGTKRLTKEEIKKINAAVAPNSEDLKKFAVFLKQSDTGIFRLLPDFGCETKNLIKVSGDCANFIPGKWAYSFRLKDYGNEDFHDISFKKNDLFIDSLLTQGILVSLGDLDLDKITLNSKGLNFLTNFIPETDKKTVGEQYEQISNGIENNGFIYTNNLKVEENTTYALRIIAYKFKDKWSTRLWYKNADKLSVDERKFAGIDYDKRSDSLFVFRVIRKNDVGDITIVWKQLSKQKSPKIVYEEDEKLTDFKTVKNDN